MKYIGVPILHMNKLRNKLINIYTERKQRRKERKKKGLGRMEEGRKKEKEIERSWL